MKILSDVAEFVVQWLTPRMGRFLNPQIGGAPVKLVAEDESGWTQDLFSLISAMTVSVGKA